MINVMKRHILIIIAAVAICGCAKEDDGEPVVDKENNIEIDGRQYELRSAEYFDGFYEFVGEDCVCLHIQLLLNGENTGAGMTVEISKELLGTRIAIAPSDVFWFFHAGTGRQSFSVENTYPVEDFGNRTGWFFVDYGEDADEIVFEWEISNLSGDNISTRGYIESAFERISEI